MSTLVALGGGSFIEVHYDEATVTTGGDDEHIYNLVLAVLNGNY